MRKENMPATRKPEDDILAAARVGGAIRNLDRAREPFRCEPDFAFMSVHGSLTDLLGRGERPR